MLIVLYLIAPGYICFVISAHNDSFISKVSIFCLVFQNLCK